MTPRNRVFFTTKGNARMDLIIWLRELTEATSAFWQWTVIFFAGAIPFVESYFAGPLGIIAGMNPVVAIVAGILGNVASMAVLVFVAGRARRLKKNADEPLGAKKQKLKKTFDKYGVPGVSLLGQTVLPSQITSMAMVAFGADQRAVILWQTISIILWGVAFSALALLGVNAFIPVGV